jgi:hypothetical protein
MRKKAQLVMHVRQCSFNVVASREWKSIIKASHRKGAHHISIDIVDVVEVENEGKDDNAGCKF